MVESERLDVLGLPRKEFSVTDLAKVEGVAGDSRTAALSNQLIVSPNPNPLIPVVAYPPPSQLRLG